MSVFGLNNDADVIRELREQRDMLLEALKGMLEVYGITMADYERRGTGSLVEVELSNQARAAIAKVTGEQA